MQADRVQCLPLVLHPYVRQADPYLVTSVLVSSNGKAELVMPHSAFPHSSRYRSVMIGSSPRPYSSCLKFGMTHVGRSKDLANR